MEWLGPTYNRQGSNSETVDELPNNPGNSRSRYQDINASIKLTKHNVILNSPVVILEPGTPVRSPEQSLQSTSEVDEAVAHEEEHGQQGVDVVDVADQNGNKTDAYKLQERFGNKNLGNNGRGWQQSKYNTITFCCHSRCFVWRLQNAGKIHTVMNQMSGMLLKLVPCKLELEQE